MSRPRNRGSRRPRAEAPVALVALVALVAGCAGAPLPTGSPGTPGPAAPIELTVFAAASLRDAFSAVEEAYTAATPGVSLVFSFDASSVLRAQVEQVAPVDVLASSDSTNPRALVEAGLTLGEPVPFAANRLAIVVPAANPASLATPYDLARPGVRIVSAGPEVPITGYAAEMLSNLERLPGGPPGFVRGVAANVVSREDNVRAVLAKVELGEGDAGIVYATDVLAAGAAVREIAIPDEANVVATYAAVVPISAPHPEAASAFLAWLGGPQGQQVLARFGFAPPAP